MYEEARRYPWYRRCRDDCAHQVAQIARPPGDRYCRCGMSVPGCGRAATSAKQPGLGGSGSSSRARAGYGRRFKEHDGLLRRPVLVPAACGPRDGQFPLAEGLPDLAPTRLQPWPADRRLRHPSCGADQPNPRAPWMASAQRPRLTFPALQGRRQPNAKQKVGHGSEAPGITAEGPPVGERNSQRRGGAFTGSPSCSRRC